MRIDPAIAELRRDPAPQRHAQAALERIRDGWREHSEVAPLLGELDRYGAGADFSECPMLDCTLADVDHARRVMALLITPMARALAGHPLGHVPFRHQYTQGLAVLQLAAAGRAALSLVCYEAHAPSAPRAETVCFASGERRELCLAGAGDARFFEVLREEPQRADIDCAHRHIAAGDALLFVSPRHTKIVDRPLRRLAILRLSRSDPMPAPAREYRIADGTLIHCASGDRAESRDEMAAAVLGAMQRADAAPVLAAIALAGSSAHLRWQALRQALALDTAAGFAALTEVALAEKDPLAPAARALRANLIERHPALAHMSQACPA